MNNIIIISGATATGKTATSIEIVKHLKNHNISSEIVNYDSLLFYRDLNIGTAKPTKDEQRLAPHKLINIRNATEHMNASDYIKIAIPLIKDLISSNIVPILVGGSTFYLRALIKGMYQSSSSSLEIQKKINFIMKNEGYTKIREILKKNDIKSYNQIHQNDEYRTIRAVEHFFQHGTPFSDEKEKPLFKDPYDFSVNIWEPINIHHICLMIPKDNHWEIMKNRTRQMIKNGLIDEVKNLLNSTYTGNEKPLQSIGYAECVKYIKEDKNDINQLIESIYISTRQLAKSQKTFLNKIKPKIVFNPITDKQLILNSIDLLFS